ncbi:hypothetical protein [Streptomyces nitrosporeus]|nr:hypothetical protein [Streptomyces nitrosporeus]GGY89023.1 hypothetical protein GCM10010327_19730 [Streptomyces nitrosporeus]
MTERYTVEQTGPRDWAVWDDKDERFVHDTTTMEAAEDHAAHLNTQS